MYKYIVIDSRSIVPPNTLGIEVTSPQLADQCELGNIDEQHSSEGGRAACEVACMYRPLPPSGATLATVRPDLDSLSAMAILSLRKGGVDIDLDDLVVQYHDGLNERIRSVARADAFVTSGEWQPRPLPTVEAPWGDHGAVEDRAELAAVNAVAFDRNLTMGVRVAVVAAWLLGGDAPNDTSCMLALQCVVTDTPADDAPEMVRTILREARARVEAERFAMVRDLRPRVTADGRFLPAEMKVREEAGIAIVEGSHRGATGLGYCLAPIVVAFNPTMPAGGRTVKKATVAFFRGPGVGVMKRLAERLNREEAAALCDDADRVGDGGGGCFVRVGAKGLESASQAIRSGDLDLAREIMLASTGDGWVDEAWVGQQRTRVFELLDGAGWGGNYASGIVGSPQEEDTALSADGIAAVVRETLAQGSNE